VGPCGLFFPNGDAAALATALQHILEEPELREALVAKGPEHLEAFQPAHIAERFLTLFRNVTPTQFH
jgi:glycosyltransferase involved in cell wall biosynthesis